MRQISPHLTVVFSKWAKRIQQLPKSRLLPLSIGGVIGLWILSGYVMRHISPPTPLKETESLSVQVQQSILQTKDLTLHLQGHTKASAVVDVRAEGEGRVVYIVEKGSKAAAKQPLVKLELEDREARLAKAKAQYQQRLLEHQAASRLEKQGFMSPNNVAKTKALLEDAKATLATAQCEVKNATVQAPVIGIIDDTKVSLGDYVLKGDKLLKLLNLNPIRAVGFVREQDIQHMALGQKGGIKLKTGEYQGTVVFISSSADPQTRMFQVELSIPNPDMKIPEGLTAELSIPLGKICAHFVSPAILTLNDEGTMGVKTVLPDHRVKFIPVKIAASEKAGVWINGLPEKAQIITVGQEFAVDGQKVAPVLQASEPQG